MRKPILPFRVCSVGEDGAQLYRHVKNPRVIV